MTLASYQSGIERTLRERPQLPASAYWALLSQSILFWRLLAVRRGAPFTAALLDRQGRLEIAVDGLLADGLASPYVEVMAQAFLKRVSAEAGLTGVLATTEDALLGAARGDSTVHVIDWPVDPAVTLASLLEPTRPLPAAAGHWVVTVSREIDGYFAVIPAAGDAPA